MTQTSRSLIKTRGAPIEGDDKPQEASLVATAELRQTLDAPAEVTESSETKVLALDELA